MVVIFAGDNTMRFRSRDPYADTAPLAGFQTFTFQRLPTEAIGSFLLILTNVVVGSAIQVESQDGTTVFHTSIAATAFPQITLSVYANGSNLNDLRIKVRKASSGTTYQPWETLATAVVGSQSIYVSQIPDE